MILEAILKINPNQTFYISYDIPEKCISYFKEKYRDTMQKNYGVDNYFQQSDKMKLHYLNALGVDNPSKSKEIQNKMFNTRLELYGDLQGAVPRKQLEETCLKRYGNKQFFGSDVGKMSNDNLQEKYNWTDEMIQDLKKRKNSMSFSWALKRANGNRNKAIEILRKRIDSVKIPFGTASKE
jgi:hypothetical protein